MRSMGMCGNPVAGKKGLMDIRFIWYSSRSKNLDHGNFVRSGRANKEVLSISFVLPALLFMGYRKRVEDF